MKYEVTQEDRDTMDRDMKSDRVLKHLKNLSFYKFTIGDVLIREDKYTRYNANGVGNHAYEWRVKLAECDLPYKYVYTFENELGIGYIRRLSINGRKYVERPICVTEFDPDLTRFSLDPEYADHMLLSNENEEFDAKSRYNEIKKKREQNNRKNKKFRLHFANETEAGQYIAKLKIGDTFWWGYSLNNIHKDPYYVTQLEVGSFPRENFFRMSQQSNSRLIGTAIGVQRLMRDYFFTQRPTFLDEIIN